MPQLIGQTESLATTSAWENIGEVLVLLLAVSGEALAALLVGLAWAMLLAGCGVRRRHVFWSTPLVCGILYGAYLALWPVERNATVDGLAVALVILVGVVAAVASIPLRTMVGVLRTDSSSSDDVAALAHLIHRPAATTPYPSFREGLFAPWDGFLYLCHRPALWRYGIIPIVLNLFITVLVLAALLTGGVAFAVYVHPMFEDTWTSRTLETLLAVVILLATVGLALVLWKLLEGILCGHFYGKLAEQVERELGLPVEEIRPISLAYQVGDTLRDVASLLAINFGFLLLHVVPLIGSIVGTCGSLYYDCLIFGTDYFDFPLSLRGKRRQEKREFTRRHRAHTLGLGATVFMVSFVPVVGSLILATAAVGAVLLYRRLEPQSAHPAVARAASSP